MSKSKQNSSTENSDWDLIIDSKNKNTSFNIAELFRYKDLIMMFVKRDFISLYKQTILGPLWVIIQPVLTTITFTIIFGNIAQIDTGKDQGLPPLLFYMLGVTAWTYFADCVTKTSETFSANQNIFGKVYFPRLTTPLSIVITNLIKLLVQLILFLCFYAYYIFFTDTSFQLSWHLLLIPVLVLVMAILGLGIGLIISSLTTKYRDLKFLIAFGIQLAMYGTPIVYPLAAAEKYQWILKLNPMTNIIETFKVALFGTKHAQFDPKFLLYSILFSIITLVLGTRLFNKVEKSFMDTI